MDKPPVWEHEGDDVPAFFLFGTAIVVVVVALAAQMLVARQLCRIDGVVQRDRRGELREVGGDGGKGRVFAADVVERVVACACDVCAAVLNGEGACEAKVALADEQNVVVFAKGNGVFAL